MKLALAIIGLFGLSNAANTYVATFDSDITGTVTVDNGHVIVDLDLSSISPIWHSTCTSGGLRYHIHTMWGHPNVTGPIWFTECGSDYTGGHWDPWHGMFFCVPLCIHLALHISLAHFSDCTLCLHSCAVSHRISHRIFALFFTLYSLGCHIGSGNAYCDTTMTNYPDATCLPSSAYSADWPDFANDVFSAEVGDWYGKYGLLEMDSDEMIYAFDGSFYEVIPEDVAGYSVVFHCNDGTRAFCAPFIESSTATSQTIPNQGLVGYILGTLPQGNYRSCPCVHCE